MLEKLSNFNDNIDELLNGIIDKQNEVTIQLDGIQEQLVQKKGLEADFTIESIEEIYEKGDSLSLTKKEVENNIEKFASSVSQPPKTCENDFCEGLNNLSFLEANIVIYN